MTTTTAIQGLQGKFQVMNRDITEIKEEIAEVKAMLKSVTHTLSSCINFISRDKGGSRPKPSHSSTT